MSVGLFSQSRCDDCGRFATLDQGASSAMIFDFVAMCPSYDHLRCRSCTEKLGRVRSNAKPSNGDMAPYETYRWTQDMIDQEYIDQVRDDWKP